MIPVPLPKRAARLGLSRRELARALGRLAELPEPPYASVDNWWYGRTAPPWTLVAALALMERHPEDWREAA